MTIKFNVLNYSNYASDSFIKNSIDNFLNELVRNGVNINNITIEYNNTVYFNVVKKFIDKNDGFNPLIEDFNFLLTINQYYPMGEKFIIIGEDLPTLNKWGEARGDLVAIIKEIIEKNIWHEIAHIIGAEDHYNEDTKAPISECIDDNCIMRFGKKNGVLCKKTIDEISAYINRSVSRI